MLRLLLIFTLFSSLSFSTDRFKCRDLLIGYDNIGLNAKGELTGTKILADGSFEKISVQSDGSYFKITVPSPYEHDFFEFDKQFKFHLENGETEVLSLFQISNQPERLKKIGVLEEIKLVKSRDNIFLMGINKESPPVVEEGYILRESSNEEAVDVMDLGTALFDTQIRTRSQVPEARVVGKYNGVKFAPVQYIQRKGKNTMSIFDFESRGMAIPKFHVYKYKQHFYDYLNAVIDAYKVLEPKLAEGFDDVVNFYKVGTKFDGITRSVLFTETTTPIEESYQKREFLSGLIMTKPYQKLDDLRMDFSYGDSYRRLTDSEYEKAVQDATSFPLDVAFDTYLDLEHRHYSAEVSKLFDFVDRRKRKDPILTITKYIRLIYHRFRDDLYLKYLYFHSGGIRRTSYYSRIKAKIEKVSLPKLENGNYDYSVFNEDSPYMKIEAVKDLWERIKRSHHPEGDGLVIGLSKYGKKQLESTGKLDYEFIFVVDLDDWQKLTIDSYKH